jgi:hypothetical protein
MTTMAVKTHKRISQRAVADKTMSRGPIGSCQMWARSTKTKTAMTWVWISPRTKRKEPRLINGGRLLRPQTSRPSDRTQGTEGSRNASFVPTNPVSSKDQRNPKSNNQVSSDEYDHSPRSLCSSSMSARKAGECASANSTRRRPASVTESGPRYSHARLSTTFS